MIKHPSFSFQPRARPSAFTVWGNSLVGMTKTARLQFNSPRLYAAFYQGLPGNIRRHTCRSDHCKAELAELCGGYCASCHAIGESTGFRKNERKEEEKITQHPAHVVPPGTDYASACSQPRRRAARGSMNTHQDAKLKVLQDNGRPLFPRARGSHHDEHEHHAFHLTCLGRGQVRM